MHSHNIPYTRYTNKYQAVVCSYETPVKHKNAADYVSHGSSRGLFLWIIVTTSFSRGYSFSGCGHAAREIPGIYLVSAKNHEKVGEGAAPVIQYSYVYDLSRFFLLKKWSFLQNLYCFQHDRRAVGNTPYGKRHISRTKPVKPLQSILEDSLHWLQSSFNYV